MRAGQKWACAILGGLALVGTACGASGSSSVTSSSSSAGTESASTESASPDLSGVTLTIAVSTSRGKGRQAARLASGAYTDAPYRIKWVEFANGDEAMQAVMSGAADVMADLQTTNAVSAAGNAKEPWTAETRRFSVVGGVRVTSERGALLVVKPGSGINTIADLKGKKVTYSKGSSSEFFWSLLAKEAGFTVGDVEEVKLKLSEAKTAFLAGEVDAIVSFDYNLLSMIRTEGLRILASTGEYDVPLYSFIVVRTGMLDDPLRAAAVADVIGRIHTAEQWPRSNVAEARRIWEELDGLDPADSEQFVISGVSEPIAIDATVVAAVQQQIDVFAARGIIEHQFDANVLFDLRFAD